MLKIKVNKKRIGLKSAEYLTNSEYFSLLTSKTGINVMSYINAVTILNFSDIKNIENKGLSLNLINTYIGNIKTVEYFQDKAKPAKDFIFRDTLIDMREFEITYGTRQMYENFAPEKFNFEAALYLVAIFVNNKINKAKEYDIKSTQSIYDELLKKYYLDTMPTAFFFLKKLTAIYRKEMRFLKVQKFWEILKLKTRINKQEATA